MLFQIKNAQTSRSAFLEMDSRWPPSKVQEFKLKTLSPAKWFITGIREFPGKVKNMDWIGLDRIRPVRVLFFWTQLDSKLDWTLNSKLNSKLYPKFHLSLNWNCSRKRNLVFFSDEAHISPALNLISTTLILYYRYILDFFRLLGHIGFC